jgi:RNA polymerase sigma factor (sigma-70 family)
MVSRTYYLVGANNHGLEGKHVVITEDNVVQHIKHKNEQAITYMIHQYGGLIATIIRHHLHDQQQDYEECLDDVLLAVWNHIDAFDPARNSFKQWIAAIAKYKAIDYLRRRITLNNRQFSVAEIDDSMLSGSVARETSDVTTLLEQLSEQERAIFEKYYMEGYPLGEIAQAFQAKESWVYNKLSRGRKKLRLYLARNNKG